MARKVIRHARRSITWTIRITCGCGRVHNVQKRPGSVRTFTCPCGQRYRV